jgi:hypothetical protein
MGRLGLCDCPDRSVFCADLREISADSAFDCFYGVSVVAFEKHRSNRSQIAHEGVCCFADGTLETT